MYVDKSRTYIGIVEDNKDPKKLGRCRIRVIDIFDDIPKNDIPWASPWKDLNGNAFNVPEIGKIVTVIFDSGNIYKPEYIYADHYNINLEKKLSELSGSNYTSMKALIFDHKTQIYVNDEEGLKLDHKFNVLNITKDTIDLNLKDNFGHVNIGTSTANQQAILGNHFLNWFDDFISNLLGEKGGPYLGNLGSPVVANPEFIEICQKYRALKDPKFLSHHVNIVDNSYVDKLDRINNPQVGDKFKSTINGENNSPSENVDYKPIDGNSTDTPPGQLSTAVNKDGVAEIPDSSPGPIEPSGNVDVDRIIRAMQRMNYKVFTRPYEMNIVGIRRRTEGMKYSNAFDDTLWLFYKTDGTANWKVHNYTISTMPGFYPAIVYTNKDGELKLKRDDKNGINVKLTSIMKKRGGMGILKEAQYINIYSIGKFPKGSPAMVTNQKTQKCYRDNTDGDTIKYIKEESGNLCMYIHKGYAGGTVVNNWSEGCQVFKSESSLKQFFEICEEHKKQYGNLFTYTLMLEKDL
jgi:hypothetical protein